MKKLFVALFACALFGCSTLESNINTTRLMVMTAVGKGAIEKGDTPTWATRAKVVEDSVSKARTILAGESVTVGLLESSIRAKLATQNMTPADRIIVDAAITAAIVTIRQETGVSDDTIKLATSQLYKVSVVLGWIEDAAKLYQ